MMEILGKLAEFVGKAADVARGARPVQVLHGGLDGRAFVATQGEEGWSVGAVSTAPQRITPTHVTEQQVDTLEDFVLQVGIAAKGDAVTVVRFACDALVAAYHRGDESDQTVIQHTLLPGEHRQFFDAFALKDASHVALLETFRHVRATLRDQQAWKDLEMVESATTIKSMAQGPMGYVATVSMSGGIEDQRSIPQRLVFDLNLYEQTQKVPVEVLLSARLSDGKVLFTARVNTSKLILEKNRAVRDTLRKLGLSDLVNVSSGKIDVKAFTTPAELVESK